MVNLPLLINLGVYYCCLFPYSLFDFLVYILEETQIQK